MKNKVYLFAGMALTYGGVSLAANEGSQASATQNALTIQQLVAKCIHLQGFEQIKQIDAQITCSAERMVWVNRGPKDPSQFSAPKTGVEFSAHIKGKYQSQQYAVDLTDLLNNLPLRLQKWRFSVMQTVTIKSCQQLQQIADNPSYCAQQFSQLKDQTLQQMVQERTGVGQTLLESDNMTGELVQEILTTPAKVSPAAFL
jgi:hypothetical protein